MRILIVGGGIAGLSLGAHLSKYDSFETVIVEEAPEWKDLGYVIVIWPNGLCTLKEYDVYARLENDAVIPKRFTMRNGKGEVEKQLDFKNLQSKYGPFYSIRRSLFQRFLLSLNAQNDIRLGTTVQSMKRTDDQWRVTLSNGRVEEFDVVVGCDGLESETRTYVCDTPATVSSGITGFLMMADIKGLLHDEASEAWSHDRFMGIFPCVEGNFHIIMACPTEEYVKRQTLSKVAFIKEFFSDMGWITHEVLQQDFPESAIYSSEWHGVEMDVWHKDRVVLVGDSAHAMMPTLGMGANMALEDSYVLAHKLHEHQNIDAALESYFTERQHRVNSVMRDSMNLTDLIKVRRPWSQFVRDALLHLCPVPLVEEHLDKILSYDVTAPQTSSSGRRLQD